MLRTTTLSSLFSLFNKYPPLLPSPLYQSYFKPKSKGLPDLVANLIRVLGEGGESPNHLRNVLDVHLSVQNKDRSPAPQLVPLLTAFHHIDLPESNRFQRKILQVMYRHQQIGELMLDEVQLPAFISEALSYDRQIKDKIKWSIARSRSASVVRVSMGSVNAQNIHPVMKMLLHYGGSHDNLTVQGAKYARIAEDLHGKLRALWERVLGRHSEESKIAGQLLLSQTANFYDMYPPSNKQDVELYWRVVEQQLKGRQKANSFYAINILKYMGTEKDNNGEWYKQKMLALVLQLMDSGMKMQQLWHYQHLTYSILSFEFYKTMQAAPFQQEDDFNYLLPEDISRPELPPCFLKMYRARPEQVHNNHIMRHVLKELYPEHCIQRSPSENKKALIPPSTSENQIQARIQMALEILGLPARTSKEISGRFVDFVLEDGTVIECDGDKHFHPLRMEFTESTQFRNSHLCLAGHRLLLISIFEYNIHRDAAALARLIERKLELMREKGAIMVI